MLAQMSLCKFQPKRSVALEETEVPAAPLQHRQLPQVSIPFVLTPAIGLLPKGL
jgi:hypothetical protein